MICSIYQLLRVPIPSFLKNSQYHFFNEEHSLDTLPQMYRNPLSIAFFIEKGRYPRTVALFEESIRKSLAQSTDKNVEITLGY